MLEAQATKADVTSPPMHVRVSRNESCPGLRSRDRGCRRPAFISASVRATCRRRGSRWRTLRLWTQGDPMPTSDLWKQSLRRVGMCGHVPHRPRRSVSGSAADLSRRGASIQNMAAQAKRALVLVVAAPDSLVVGSVVEATPSLARKRAHVDLPSGEEWILTRQESTEAWGSSTYGLDAIASP